MGKLKIVWTKKAYLQYVSIAEWYAKNVCLKAASSFVSGISETVNKIAEYPTIGAVDHGRSTKRYKYRSYLSHPKYRVVYRVTKDSVRIVAIHCNLKNSNFI